MLENRDDYEFLTENALKRIDVKGAPYPVRSQKLVITGEDEAYLREAMLDRQYIMGRSFADYDSAILRITQTILRAKWLYDSLVDILAGYVETSTGTSKVTWMDADKVEDYESVMPSGAVVSLYGQNPTSTKPAGVDAAISSAAQDIKDLEDGLKENIENRYDALSEDIDALYETRDSLVEQAEQTRDAAISSAESSLQSDLEQMKSKHEAAVKAIEDEYQKAMEDPDADHAAARKKYEEDLLTENNDYAMDVSARRDKARLEKVVAEDDCRKAVWDADCDLYDEAKRKFKSFADDVKNLEDACHDDIVDVESQRNQTVAALEQSVVYFGYLDFDDRPGEPLEPTGDGVAYSDALSEMADVRKDMEIDALCVDKYLRKTPLLPIPTKAEGVTAEVRQDYVAHAPASDATMRAYADLERMRCLAIVPPDAYRDAFYTGDPQDIVSYHDAQVADETPLARFYDSNGRVQVPYSDTSFSVFFGRRLELEKDWIDAIYATVRIYRAESAWSDDVPYTVNRTLGFMRVKLERVGIECESDLADIDGIRDRLAEDIAALAETRDAAYKSADDAYYLAVDSADKAYDDAIDKALSARTDAEDAAHRSFMTSMEAAEREFNTRVAEIEEDDDLTDGEKARQIDAARSRYNSALATALDAETDRREAARETYLSAETAAVEARSDATEAAVQARATAKGAAKDAYDDAVAPLQEAAQDAIDDIYERPGKRRQDARDDYDDAIDAARNQRDAATDAALDAFDTALHSLTVDGNPILPDHAGYLQDTSTFPYRTLTPEAYDEASQAERSAFNAAFNAANSAYNSAVEQYNAARRQASYDYWLEKKGIGDIREDARCRWSFTPEAIDSDRLSLPTGDNPNYSCMLYMAGIEHFDVVYKPKSLTGADFSQYYAELDE